MDSFDRILIGELSSSCRVSFTALAEKYDISVNGIKKRVEKLVEERIILAFDVQLRLESVGASFAAISLKLAGIWSKSDRNHIGKHPNIYAMGIGLQPEAFTIAVYRNNSELTDVLDYLRVSESIISLEVVPLLPPTVGYLELPSKDLDSLKQIDWQILKHLKWNGRMRLGELAERVGTSVPSVRKRLDYMRKHRIVQETILVNPGAASQGLVVGLIVDFSNVAVMEQYQLDELLFTELPEYYWLSWRIADRTGYMLTFQADSTKEVIEIQEKLGELIPNCKIISQVIVGEWEYFPDIRDAMIAERTKET